MFEFFHGLFSYLISALGNFFSWIGDGLKNMLEGIRGFFKNLIDALGGFFSWLGDLLVGIFNAIKSFFAELFEPVILFFKGVVYLLTKCFQIVILVIQVIFGIFKLIGAVIEGIFNTFSQLLGYDGSTSHYYMPSAYSQGWDTVAGFFNSTGFSTIAVIMTVFIWMVTAYAVLRIAGSDK